MRILIILLCAVSLAVSCKPTQGKTDEEFSKIAFREELNEVKTMDLATSTFQKELVYSTLECLDQKSLFLS